MDAPDIDFSGDDGLAESRHVFLAGNRLPQAWHAAERFVISELGFGTGLNALAVGELWHRQRSAGRPAPPLVYQSVEWRVRPPGTFFELARRWPELQAVADEAERVVVPQPGWNRWTLSWGELVLFVGDAAELPPASRFEPSDAWFLDGYSPAKDLALWTPELLAWVGRTTKPGGTAATYTSAGIVKRTLRESGFLVTRKPGWGKKRHMLCAARNC